ncbi:hypothetical protein SCHIN_v1c03740 [Spiroplasma chinense]|uniref:Uncharacterized protein n=1 Tax=Spiroplasma chinense TaxID=216932 RepID=A0A5B9Y3I9_9MOLU|nr:hypothetical protein [Spiroplasma chinense]QEH61571.1 hypothetical protein SCHIN_v1c03740 [Spiroplasma chinense]
MLTIFAASCLFFGVAIGNYNNITNIQNVKVKNHYKKSKNKVLELSRIKVEDFETDLAIFDNKHIDENTYLEEIKWSMIDSNPHIEDELFNIWDSYLYNEPSQWFANGIDWEMPDRNEEILTRVTFRPKNLSMFKGALSFKMTLVNKSKRVYSLNSIIKNKNLGTISDNSVQSLMNNIETKNKDYKINWTQLKISSINNRSALITPIMNSEYYRGELKIEFLLGINLNDVINNFELGTIKVKIDEQLILDILAEKNNKVDIKELKVQNIDLEREIAVVVPINENSIYYGSIEVTFKEIKHLSSIIKNTFLGAFSNVNTLSVVDMIVRYNEGATHYDFLINHSTVTYTGFEIYGREDNHYFGTVRISFLASDKWFGKIESGRRQVDSYMTLQTDIKIQSIRFTPSLGKTAFLENYRWLNFDAFKFAKLNKDVKINEKKGGFKLELTKYSGGKELFHYSYSNVNWMKSYAFIEYRWEYATIVLSILTAAEAHAKQQNAAWARATTEVNVNNFYFS